MPFIQDMQNASASFFRTLQPEDYIAVATYDMRTHILTRLHEQQGHDARGAAEPDDSGFSETNEFDALYETLDRLTRVEGRKYIILISSGRDTHVAS